MSRQVLAYELANEMDDACIEFVGDVWVPTFEQCANMLRKLQAENDAWQSKYETDYAKAFENGYSIGLSHGKGLANNG